MTESKFEAEKWQSYSKRRIPSFSETRIAKGYKQILYWAEVAKNDVF